MNRPTIAMQQITYVDVWSVDEQQPGRVFTIDEARARHAAGQTYTVLVGDPTAPEKVLELALALGSITLRFLDERRRVRMNRFYAVHDGNRVFEEQTSYFDYLDTDVRGERPAHWETTDYAEDGTWTQTEHFSDTGPDVTHGSVLDVASLWEELPAFGEYRRISRYDDRDA